MIGIGVGIGFSRRAAGAAPAFAAEALAIFAAMEPEPDAARKTAINDFVVALKAGNPWAKLDFLHVYAAHSEASALINWRNPGTHNATAVNAPTFTVDRGFAGDGTSSYLNSNFVPSTDGVNYTLNDASLGVYSRTDSAGTSADMGARNDSGTSRTHLELRVSGESAARVNQDSFNNHTELPSSTGLAAAQRVNDSEVQLWRNGLLFSTIAASSSFLIDFALTIGSLNNADVPTRFSTRQYALSFAGAAMSEAEQLAFYNATQDYMTALGAEV